MEGLIFINIKDLIPYENNPRFNDNAVDAVVASIKEFGFKVPIIVDKNNVIIAGHTRLKAAQKLGLEEVPVIVADDLTEEQIKAFRLADNKVSELAEWDFSKLEAELNGLEIDMTAFNFDMKELSKEFDKNKEVTEDDFDIDAELEKIEEPIVKRGQLWKLGEHYLMCGDSTSKEDVERLMNGNKASVVFTSPPYNGNTKLPNGGIFSNKGDTKLYDDGYSDDLSSKDYIDFCKNVLNICFEYTDGYIYWNVNYNSNSKYEYIKQIEDKLERLIEQVCWKKTNAMPLKGVMRRAWEPIYVFSTSNKNLKLNEIVTNFWEVSNNNIQLENHKACFPVELPAKGIKISSKEGCIVLEPFGGSGSTLIACEQLNRRCYTMELDEKYCDVIIKRWETLTGKQAVKL